MGKKTVVERKVLHVHVDRGVKTGHKVEFRGEGDQAPGVLPGDVVFEIEQKPHARFQRKDDDLFYHAEIDLLTALAGGQIYIEHLDERWLTVNIFPGEPITPGEWFNGTSAFVVTNNVSGAIKVIKGQGMPSFRHHDFGNLYIQFDVKFPEKSQVQNLELLEQVLPPRMQQRLPPGDGMVEDFDLEDVDPRQQARAQGATGGDEDEDGIPAGAERMQCASQ
jgi:DnaJ family protein A protein 2